MVSRTAIHEAFYGLEFSGSGDRLYCSGGSDEVVHVFDFKEGKLTRTRILRLHDAKQRGIPCGMAISGDAQDLYVANVWGQRVSVVDLRTHTNLPDIFLEPGGVAAAANRPQV